MNVRISSKDEQSLAQENAALRNEVNNLKEQLALLQEQFDWLKKTGFRQKDRTDLRHHGWRHTAHTVSG